MTAELDALILRHLADFNLAAKRMEFDIAPAIAGEINSTVSRWARENRWTGVFEWHQKKDVLWLAPPEWKIPNEADDAYYFWFELDTTETDGFGETRDLDYNWLVRLTGAGSGSLGFCCYAATEHFGGKQKWKKFLADKMRSAPAAFIYQERGGSFFLPVRVDLDNLVQAVAEDDVSRALAPFTDALDVIAKGKPSFSSLLKDAKKTLVTK